MKLTDFEYCPKCGEKLDFRGIQNTNYFEWYCPYCNLSEQEMYATICPAKTCPICGKRKATTFVVLEDYEIEVCQSCFVKYMAKLEESKESEQNVKEYY